MGKIESYAETCAFVRAGLLFALVRASSLCLRGSRIKWRSGLGFDDGASLPAIMQQALAFLCLYCYSYLVCTVNYYVSFHTQKKNEYALFFVYTDTFPYKRSGTVDCPKKNGMAKYLH